MTINETEEDRTGEEEAIIRLARVMNAKFWMFPPLFPVDALIEKDGVIRIVEYKRRHISRGDFGFLKIDKEKITNGLRIAHICNARFILAVEWNDQFAAGWIKPQDAANFRIDPEWKNDRGEIDVAYEIPAHSNDWKRIP
jgi:hypothetical protein